MDIIKASGEKQKFSKEKLYKSIKRAGAEPKLAKKAAEEVAKKAYHGITSKDILNRAVGYLKKENPMLAARYNLKKAIMELGPTGFPFEKYIAEILREYGYTVKVGSIVNGYCVRHEIDVIAEKENKHFIIECKYHNSNGHHSNIKTALYTFARFLDVKKSWEKIKRHTADFHQVWLATNTRCTSQAIRYARCVGLKILSWRYPKNKSLEYLIEKKGLYPITILPSLNSSAKEKLTEKGIMLTKNLLDYSIDELAGAVGIQQNTAKRLKKEAQQLCL